MKKLIFVFTLLVSCNSFADEQAELAIKLSNPVANLISVPVDFILEEGIGPTGDGEASIIKASPVLPFTLNDDWNLISRTVISYVDQDGIPGKGMGESGFGDIAESIFFSPSAPTERGWIWGVGGIFLLDSATEDELGAGKWGMGPTALGLKQVGGLTFGALGHYLVDVAGDDDRSDIEQFFLQPFMAYTIEKTKTTFALQAESTHDLEADETGTVAIFHIGQMFKLGSQIMQGRIGVRSWVDETDFGPEGTTFTARLTFLFPK
jgi:hypothetical protein